MQYGQSVRHLRSGQFTVHLGKSGLKVLRMTLGYMSYDTTRLSPRRKALSKSKLILLLAST